MFFFSHYCDTALRRGLPASFILTAVFAGLFRILNDTLLLFAGKICICAALLDAFPGVFAAFDRVIRVLDYSVTVGCLTTTVLVVWSTCFDAADHERRLPQPRGASQ